ncbi:MAG TPA: PilN domain-containing protein [Desulfuromonadales bacterium]|nr:PilN domain-containing protein [Desulfuromonadales bacterium]
MIRINLLPVRAAKKKETAVQQFILAGVVAVFIALIITSLYLVKRVQITSTKSDISAANAKINELKTKIGKLEELKTLKTEVKKKLDVLAQLRKNKMGPAQRLSSLSDLTPDQLWLTGYSEKDSEVRISGVATVEELIAQYMRALEASNDFMAVELVVSEQIESAGTKLKKFEIIMKLEAPTATLPTPAEKK